MRQPQRRVRRRAAARVHDAGRARARRGHEALLGRPARARPGDSRKFRPGGFAALAGHQVGRDTVLPLGTVLGAGPAGRLVQEVLAVEDDLDRAAVLDAHLLRDVPEPDPAYHELLEVLAAMLHDRTLVRVDDVATGAGTTVRSLQRLFHRFVGVGPKTVLQRYRLQDAAAAIDAGEVDDLASLAADLGWFDQAHFSRDFRSTVGVTPSEYLARAVSALVMSARNDRRVTRPTGPVGRRTGR